MENSEILQILEKVTDKIEDLEKKGKAGEDIIDVKKTIEEEAEEEAKKVKAEAERVAKKLKMRWLV